MNKRNLGKSYVQLTEIGLGTWESTKEQCTHSVATALTTGYTFIDTAQAYRNEEYVGKGIAAAGIPRRASAGGPRRDGAPRARSSGRARGLHPAAVVIAVGFAEAGEVFQVHAQITIEIALSERFFEGERTAKIVSKEGEVGEIHHAVKIEVAGNSAGA